MTQIAEKGCTGCGEIKPLTSFYERSDIKGAYYSRCKDCEKVKYRRQADRAGRTPRNRPEPRVRDDGVTVVACATCRTDHPIEHYRIKYGYRDGSCRRCLAKRCKVARDKKIERYRARVVAGKYGISPETYDYLALMRGNRCDICGEVRDGVGANKRLNIDHCHIGGEIRGLLCSSCNAGLGRFKDDPGRLRSAAAYLEAAQRRKAQR